MPRASACSVTAAMAPNSNPSYVISQKFESEGNCSAPTTCQFRFGTSFFNDAMELHTSSPTRKTECTSWLSFNCSANITSLTVSLELKGAILSRKIREVSCNPRSQLQLHESFFLVRACHLSSLSTLYSYYNQSLSCLDTWINMPVSYF